MKIRFVIVVYLAFTAGGALTGLLAVYALDAGPLGAVFLSGRGEELIRDVLFGVAAPLVLLVAWCKRPVADIGLVNTGVKKILVWAVIGVVVSFLQVKLAMRVFTWPSYSWDSWRNGLDYLPLWGLVALRVLEIGIVSSVAQEVFFRGIFQRYAAQRAGRVAGVLITALFFAAWHHQLGRVLSYHAVTFGDQAVAGLILGYLYEKTGSLYTPILCHAAWNTYCVVSEMLF